MTDFFMAALMESSSGARPCQHAVTEAAEGSEFRRRKTLCGRFVIATIVDLPFGSETYSHGHACKGCLRAMAKAGANVPTVSVSNEPDGPVSVIIELDGVGWPGSHLEFIFDDSDVVVVFDRARIALLSRDHFREWINDQPPKADEPLKSLSPFDFTMTREELSPVWVRFGRSSARRGITYILLRAEIVESLRVAAR